MEQELINSLLAGKNGLKVFHGKQLKEYSKLIISFLCGHYQMPAKFNKYKDPTDFFHNAIYKNNSRFLSWFGIRYYIDLVSASKNNQYNNYIKRRLHEAAIFELVERKEKIIGDPRGNGVIKLPSEKTIRFRASPNLNKLFSNKK